MTLEIRKETTTKETWYYLFKDHLFQRAYLTLEDAEKAFADIIYEHKNPPKIEVIKSITI